MATKDTPGRLLYEFGPFSLDPVKRLLMRQGQSVPVPPRAVDVLLTLIARRGSPVDKDDLLRLVWRDTVVEENNLSVSISMLRKALGEGIRDHRYIVTLPRRGYAFVASVTERAAEHSAVPIADPRHRSHVLVLPFDVMGKPVAGVEPLLGRSLAEGVASRLGGSQHVAVITLPATSGRAHREAVALGRKSRAEFVLVGSVRQDGSRLRLMTRLLRVADNTAVWGTTFEDGSTDQFAAEGRIVERVAQGLSAHFEEDLHQRTARRSAESADAHRDYIRGRFFWNKRTEEGIRKALEHFERAIHADPGYALPYSGLADCFLLLSTYGVLSPRQAIPKAVRAATRALEIDDTLGEAYTSLAYARFAYYWQWEEAETGFRRALELNPGYATGHHLYGDHLAAAGRFDEAIASLQRALAIEPLSLIINTDLGWVLFHARRWTQGIEQLSKTLEMDGRFPAARWVLGLTRLHAGDAGRAVQELESARLLAPESPHILGSLAQALGMAGQSGKAKMVLRDLRHLARRSYVSPYHFAVAHLGGAAHDAAVRELRHAVAERAHWAAYFRITPTLDVLRDHPGFLRLLEQLAPDDRIDANPIPLARSARVENGSMR